MTSLQAVPYDPPAATAKGFRGGTHRLYQPAETLDRLRPLLPSMGITRVANVTGLDCIGIPVAMACRPNARSLSVSQGKGRDLDAAMVSALMESVEAYHAEHIAAPLLFGSFDELSERHRLIDVARLPRECTSIFTRQLSILWIEGTDLFTHDKVWVPYESVYSRYTLPPPPGANSFLATTNGLASGNHQLEAISHAICELVERDATTLWHSAGDTGRSATRLDLTTVNDSDCLWALERFERARVDVAVWETTSDVGIPSFECLIVERADDPLRLLYPAEGAGCHPSRSIALLRALTEAAQCRLTAITGSRDDLFRSYYHQIRDPEALRVNRMRAGATAETAASFQAVPNHEAETFDEDVAWELERLRSAGITEVVVVDLTNPNFNIPVVRVVVPGLEGIDDAPEYQPGARARAIGGQSA